MYKYIHKELEGVDIDFTHHMVTHQYKTEKGLYGLDYIEVNIDASIFFATNAWVLIPDVRTRISIALLG